MKKRATTKRAGKSGGRTAGESFVDKWAGKFELARPEDLEGRPIAKAVMERWIAEDEKDAERFWRSAGLNPDKW